MNNEHKEPDNLEIKSVNQQTVDSVILADDERQAISISSTSLNESLDELFDRMRHSIPGKRLFQRKSRLNVSEANLSNNLYIQPPELFAPARVGKGLAFTVLTSKSKNVFMKIKPLKGFKDPLKLAKKCHPQIPSFPSQSSFELFHEDWQYIPPSDLRPLPHLTRRSFSESFLQYSPMMIEMKTLGKYQTPKVPKYKKSKHRSKTAIGIPTTVVTEKPKEISAEEEKYQAPIGSKDNYTCKQFIEITDANRALEEVCSVLSHDVIRKSTKERQMFATRLADKVLDKLLNSIPHKYELENDNPRLEIVEVPNSTETTIKTKSIELLEKICKDDDEINENSSDKPIEPDLVQLDLPSFAVDSIEINLARPQFVRRTVKESTSVAKWIENNILCEFRKMTGSETDIESGKMYEVERHTKNEATDASYKPPPRSPPKDAGRSQKESSKSQPRTFFANFHEKYYSRLKSKNSDQDDELWLPTVNSIDDFLKEQEQNPAVFRVFKTLCTKRFSNYGIDDLEYKKSSSSSSSSVPSSADEQFEDNGGISIDDNESREKGDENESETCCHQNLQEDDGYFASEEEDHHSFKSSRMTDDEIQTSNVWAFHPWYEKVHGPNAEEYDEDKINYNCNDSEIDRLSETVNFDDDEMRSNLSNLSLVPSPNGSSEVIVTLHQGHMDRSVKLSEFETGSVSTYNNRSRSMNYLQKQFSSRTVVPLSSHSILEIMPATESENEAKRNATNVTPNQRTKGPKILQRCISRVTSFCSLIFRSTKSKSVQRSTEKS